MRKVIMIGCDLHDGSMLLRIAVGAGAAETVLVKNSRQGRKAMIAQLLRRAIAMGGARIVFAYEASGQGFGLYDELSEAGIECYVLAPTKIARSQRQRSQKTDERRPAVAGVAAGAHLGRQPAAGGMDSGCANPRRAGTGADAFGHGGEDHRVESPSSELAETAAIASAPGSRERVDPAFLGLAARTGRAGRCWPKPLG